MKSIVRYSFFKTTTRWVSLGLALILAVTPLLVPLDAVRAQEAIPSATPTNIPTETPTPTPTVGPPPVDILDAAPPASPAGEPVAHMTPEPTPSAAPQPPPVPQVLGTNDEGVRYEIGSTSELFVPEPVALEPSLESTRIVGSSGRIPVSVRARPLARRTYKGNEAVEIIVDNDVRGDNIRVEVFDHDGLRTHIRVQETNLDGATRYSILPGESVMPGKYTVKVFSAGKEVSSQDFAWGVLAINTDKSIYRPLEQAHIAIAVLDEKGDMVCDAAVTLRVDSPQYFDVLSTEDGTIRVNPSCKSKDFTIQPDYEATYGATGLIGTYIMTLTAVTKNGSYTVKDTFRVEKEPLFDVTRQEATRIYPVYTYPVNITVKANADVRGTMVETVPTSFDITPLAGTQPYDDVAITLDDPYRLVGSSSGKLIDLRSPFDGSYPVTLAFGENVDDPWLKAKYASFGLAGHDGIDYGLPEGTPVYAVDDGVVARAENEPYGLTVILQHEWGRSYYGHLRLFAVQGNQEVRKGDLLGYSGQTGLATGPHLHFGIRLNAYDMNNGYYGKVDPAPFLEASGAPIPSTSVKHITWNISLKKDQTITLGYMYKAPEVSPQFYLTGPLRFDGATAPSASSPSAEPTPAGEFNPFVLGLSQQASGSGTASASSQAALSLDDESSSASSSASPLAEPEALSFAESRQWQIAVDAASIQQLHYRWRNDDGDELNTGDGTDGALSLTSSYNLNTTDSSADSDDNGTYADGIAFKVDPATATTSGTMVKLYDTPTDPSIAAGDEVILINLQGASGDTADVGNYEFLRISSVNTSTKEVTFTTAIQKSYDGTTPGNQKVVIQRIPQFTNLTLTSSGSLTASAWNGLTPQSVTGIVGYYTGIVAFRATGTVSLASGTSITVNGLGYRGGSGRSSDGGYNGESFDGQATDGGGSGCSSSNCAAGVGVEGGGAGRQNNGNSNTTASRGGGGGGGEEDGSDATNAGGGGGGGGYGGGGGGGGGSGDAGDLSGTGGSGGSTGIGAGGGGGASTNGTGGDGGAAGSAGSNGTNGNGGDAGSGATTGEGGGASTADGDSGGSGGGGGGIYGDSALSDIFLGSGGGGGGDSNEGSSIGGTGGNGGGIVFIAANTVSVTSTGAITANGASGTNGGDTTNPYGAGGGGAGGSVMIRAVNVSLGTNLVTATGGTGGTRGSSSNTAGAGGGSGGVGRIRVETGSVTSVTTSPAASLASAVDDMMATWFAAEDTIGTNIPKSTTKRLRFEVSNEGDTTTGAITYRLEVSGPDPTSCAAASYTRVDTDTHWDVVASSYITDNDPTANVSYAGTQALTDENTTFISGRLEDSSDSLSSTITLGTTEFTEIEFALQATSSSTDGATYCFRLTNDGSTTNFTYTTYAQGRVQLVDNPEQIHYRWRNDDGDEASATWIAAEDTSTYLSRSTTKRLRFSVNSAGVGSTGALTYRLEVSQANPSSCDSATYTRIDSSSEWAIASSSLSDGGATTNVASGLSDPNTTFVAGLQEETSDTLNSSITLDTNTKFTEIEYSLQPTSSAVGQALYCFRLTNSGSTTHFTYTRYAQAYIASPYHTQIHYRWRNDNTANWWDANWTRRKMITIDNTGYASALTNYQVKVTVTYDSDMQSDFDDIRFTTSGDSPTAIDYWRETYTAGSTATFWVEVPSIPASSTTTISMYYGNASASTTSSLDNTFINASIYLETRNCDNATNCNYTDSHTEFDNIISAGYTLRGTGSRTQINDSSDPYSSTQDYFFMRYRYLFRADTTGTHNFGTNSDDASEVVRRDAGDTETTHTVVAYWYGGHASGTCGTSGTTGSLSLTSGDVVWFEYRMTEWAGDALAQMCIQEPGGSYTTVTTTNFPNQLFARQIITTEPSNSTGSEETYTTAETASWAAAQDTMLTGTRKDTTYRVRFEISNEGQETAGSTTYRLEVSTPNPSSCSTASYTRVTSDSRWEMADSAYISDGEATTNILDGLTDENTTFVAGQFKDTGDQTSALALTSTQFTEHEFAVSSSTFVDYGTYCFRLTNAGSTWDFSYSQYAKIYLGPQVSELMRHGNFFQGNVERYFSF